LQVGHCLFALLAALLGGGLSLFFFARKGEPADRSEAGADEASGPARSRWLVPTVVGLAALVVATAVVTIASGARAPFWAGITFGMTCVLVGLAILAAALGRGRRRAIGLGAALFGAGYLALIFGRSALEPARAYFPTDQILESLRESFPVLARAPYSENARILQALRRPIPMRFANDTPLDDVLKYIKQATTTPEYPGIPIYVDPIGLQEAERSINSTVTINVEGVPLRETLRLCLGQLGLRYEVWEGRLRITSEDDQPELDLKDPFLTVGHCLLAMLAMGLGAVVAPIVAGERSAPRPGGGDRSA
jgi:hypothetical protein